MQRYKQLLGIIQEDSPATIIEVGTWNGDRAIEMATQLIADDKPCHYIGFDLFGKATKKNDALELNVKAHTSIDQVRAKLNEFAAANPKFSFVLHAGNTRDTLAGFDVKSLKGPVMAFIDGGHSCDTISSDLNYLLGCDIIIMDDYYSADENNKMPDISRFGCNAVLESVGDKDEHYFVLPIPDRVKDGGLVRMVSVGKKYDIQVSRKLQVQTKNAVSDDALQRNVLYSLREGLPEVRRYYPHEGRVTFVSGGESFKENLEQIRAEQAAGSYLVCVKTAHDYLIEYGIIPDACILLDPRAHVVDFIKTPHPKIRYYVASQVYYQTLKHLMLNKADVVLYHALVNAGESEMLGAGKFMILGGSTSATRGLSLMHTLGFRDFRLYGYDSSFQEKPGAEYMEKWKDKKSKLPMKVKVLDEDFWTTAELVAQSKDFEGLMDPASPNDSRMVVVGSPTHLTLISHLYERTYKPFEKWGWEPRQVETKVA